MALFRRRILGQYPAALCSPGPMCFIAEAAAKGEGAPGVVEQLDAWPDLDAFAARGRPAIVKGVLRGCQAYSLWTPSHLRALLGGVELRATQWWPNAVWG